MIEVIYKAISKIATHKPTPLAEMTVVPEDATEEQKADLEAENEEKKTQNANIEAENKKLEALQTKIKITSQNNQPKTPDEMALIKLNNRREGEVPPTPRSGDGEEQPPF